jgi:signal recognition particle receptor subunit beta
MATINYAAREISVKVVYYGPGLSGKTTNLQVIHKKVPPEFKSDMVSLATETDRTLFFDFLPLDLGKIKGFSTKFQLYTVPGQVYYNATRKLVLRGVDGVVFVADSGPDKVQENLESFQNLEENLAEYGYKKESIPIIIQYNKRDLPNALPIEELQRLINKYNLPWSEAVAYKGVGVFDSLKLIGKIVIDYLNKKYSRQPSRPAATQDNTPVQQQPPVQQPVRQNPNIQGNQAQSPTGNYGTYQQQPIPPAQQFQRTFQQQPQGFSRPPQPQMPPVQQPVRPQPYQQPQQPMRLPVQQQPFQAPVQQRQAPAQPFQAPAQQPFQAPAQQRQAPVQQQPTQQQPFRQSQQPAAPQQNMRPQQNVNYQQHYQDPNQHQDDSEATFETTDSLANANGYAQNAPAEHSPDYYNYGNISFQGNRPQNQIQNDAPLENQVAYNSMDSVNSQSYEENNKTDLDLEIEKYQREIEEKQRRMRTTQAPVQPQAYQAPPMQQQIPPPTYQQPMQQMQQPAYQNPPAQQQQPPRQHQQQFTQSGEDDSYEVYNMELPAYPGQDMPPTQRQPIISSDGDDDSMYFTSVDTDRQKRPVRKPVNPKNKQQQKGFLSKLFNKEEP